MSDPFRDDKAALIERVAQLQAENQELRDRLDEEQTARGENREAVTRRLSEENRELRDQLCELREELSRQRQAFDQLGHQLRDREEPLSNWLERLERLFRRE